MVLVKEWGISNMPIPAMNYAVLPVLGDPSAKVGLSSLMEGFKAGLTPFAAKQEMDKNKLANELARINLQTQPQMNQAELAFKQTQVPYLQAQAGLANQQAQYYAPNIQSEIDMRKAQIPLLNEQVKQAQFNSQNPLLSQSGAAGQAGAALYLQQHPELLKMPTPPGAIKLQPNQQQQQADMQQLPQMLLDNLKSQFAQRSALADYYGQKADKYDFTLLPSDQKKQVIAQAAGMGIDPNSAVSMLASGMTIPEIAKQQGFDPNNLPDPIYPATNTDISRIHQRQQSVAEINKLQPILTEALAPYASRVAGYSPKQIAQAITNDDPDAQARFLAAQALMPEMSSLRLKAMGGQVGIEALREVTNASMGNINSFQSLVNKDVYEKANKYMDQWINQAVSSANSAGLNAGTRQPGLTFNPNQQQAQAMVNAGMATIPPEYQQFIANAKARGISDAQIQKRLAELQGGAQ